MPRPHLTKKAMKTGLKAGRTLLQEAWCNPKEIKIIDKWLANNKIICTPWQYKDNFQCEVRKIQWNFKKEMK